VLNPPVILSVIVAGDQPLVRAGIVMLLDAQPDICEPTNAGARIDRLTPREREVMILMAHGLSNTEITPACQVDGPGWDVTA
jgi:DNA-binding NarL/FixJ family response regulator